MFGKKKEKAQSDKSRMDDFLDAAAEVSAEPDTGTNAGAGRMGAAVRSLAKISSKCAA